MSGSRPGASPVLTRWLEVERNALRDKLAERAMVVLAQSDPFLLGNPSSLARRAYDIAHAMLVERNKES